MVKVLSMDPPQISVRNSQIQRILHGVFPHQLPTRNSLQDWRAISIYLDQLNGLEEIEDVPPWLQTSAHETRETRGLFRGWGNLTVRRRWIGFVFFQGLKKKWRTWGLPVIFSLRYPWCAQCAPNSSSWFMFGAKPPARLAGCESWPYLFLGRVNVRGLVRPVKPISDTLWLFNIAMGNSPFIDGLPINNGYFPWLCES